jgi:hypothetical protein
MNTSIIMIIVLIVGLVVGIFYAVKAIINARSKLPTLSNIKRIGDTQNIYLMQKYITQYNSHQIKLLWTKPVTPSKQQLLINCSVQGCRLLGYSGPYQDGVFDEDNAVRTALRSGSRFFTLDIYIDHVTGNPVSMYRNKMGYLVSLNKGNIRKIAASLANRAFTTTSDSSPQGVITTPVILFLYFHDTPDYVKEPGKYIKFLSAVAKQLKPLSSALLDSTPMGDFRRQQQDSQIWFQPMTTFTNKIILLCNVDTTIMRQATMYGVPTLSPDQDLDMIVNARVYAQESGGMFGATLTQSSTAKAAAIICTPSYFLNIPPDKIQDSILLTKSVFTICMDPNPEITPTAADINKLITEFGVHTVPFTHFDDQPITDKWLGVGSIYNKESFATKPLPLQYIPPEHIVLNEPSSRSNANGGLITAPKL